MTKRMKTQDVAFGFRMGAGFAGDVNRTHPASIEPVLNNVTTPVTAFGQPVLIDTATQSARPFAAADQSDSIAAGYGVAVRPYPYQQMTASNFGEATIGAGAVQAGAIDVLRSGYIMVKLAAGGTPKKGQPVYVWSAATSGNHIQGGVEAAFTTTKTTELLNATFNGSPDASGNVEIAFNI